MKTELLPSRITRAYAPAFNQGTKAWQRPVIVALKYLVVAFTAALGLSAALTRYPLAAGGVLGQAYGQG